MQRFNFRNFVAICVFVGVTIYFFEDQTHGMLNFIATMMVYSLVFDTRNKE